LSAILLTSCKDVHLIKDLGVVGIAAAYPIIQQNRSIDLEYFLDYANLNADLYDMVGEVSLNWHKKRSHQEFDIGSVLHRRVLVEFSSVLRFYLALEGCAKVHGKVLVSCKAPSSLLLVSKHFPDNVEFFYSDNEFDKHITPSPRRGLVSGVRIRNFLSKCLRVLQGPFFKQLKNKVLIFNDWTYRKVMNSNCLNINTFNPMKSFCLRQGKEYLPHAECLFPKEIGDNKISPNIKEVLSRFALPFNMKRDLIELFTKVVQQEYCDNRSKFIETYCAYQEMFDYYQPTMVISPGYSTAEYQILHSIAKSKQTPTMFIQDGFTFFLDRYLFSCDKGKAADYFAVMGKSVERLYLEAFKGSNIKTVGIRPPVVSTHKSHKSGVESESAIILFPYGFIFSPSCRWDKRYQYVVDVAGMLLSLGYKDIKVKMKHGFEPFDRETENQLMKELLDQEGYFDVELIFGSLFDHLHNASLVVGQIGTAIIETIYHKIPYYVYEPYSLGLSDATLKGSILDIKIISRDVHELRKSILKQNIVKLNKREIFGGDVLDSIDYENIIQSFHNKTSSTDQFFQ